MASADLLLHPVRLRIVKAFLGDRALTTTQLAAELDDVPAGSIYRGRRAPRPRRRRADLHPPPPRRADSAGRGGSHDPR